ncbi:PilZ domain-containing protein [Maridesulfovibrio ferrireducens]|uniref:PilZ domain-containing protein n=1 Tax=Maridesulfovibrio ferrireducens TaxID=246191 RepID=A0A1G9JQT1_9BACT|nr:PilZ domain-containing protein [Maridesulfovibrio ferrireducens]SDL39575.1 PilZ domain-containing protein [Maridesulfovibrio ferrireducens]
MDLSYESSNKARGAFRTSVPGLAIRIKGYPDPFSVKDFSVNGLAFTSGKDVFEVGTPLEVDLLLGSKEILLGITLEIVRDIGKGLMGCIFIGLDKYQEARLDKLVLEIQKRMILLRKKKGAS